MKKWESGRRSIQPNDSIHDPQAENQPEIHNSIKFQENEEEKNPNSSQLGS